jgi:hypothetical protein
MNEIYDFWKEKLNTNVVFTGELLMLDKGTVGVLHKVYPDWAMIHYPQNIGYEPDGKGGWKPIKGAPNQVSYHSCKLDEIESV